MTKRSQKLKNSQSIDVECSKLVRDRRAITMKRSQISKRNRKLKANTKSVKEDMVEINEQQQRIEDGRMEIRRKFEEIEFECDKLKRETSLISLQTLCNQQRLCLMFKILKAREDNDVSLATELTQFLRELMMQDMRQHI